MAKLFWKERKNEKAKKWIEKAILLNKKIADSWVALYFHHKFMTSEKEEAKKIH